MPGIGKDSRPVITRVLADGILRTADRSVAAVSAACPQSRPASVCSFKGLHIVPCRAHNLWCWRTMRIKEQLQCVRMILQIVDRREAHVDGSVQRKSRSGQHFWTWRATRSLSRAWRCEFWSRSSEARLPTLRAPNEYMFRTGGISSWDYWSPKLALWLARAVRTLILRLQVPLQGWLPEALLLPRSRTLDAGRCLLVIHRLLLA